MTDIYDQATAREELEREIALQAVRYSARPLPQGECNLCQREGLTWSCET